MNPPLFNFNFPLQLARPACADVSRRMARENVGRIPAAQQRGTGQLTTAP
jgi:hypothetical protein